MVQQLSLQACSGVSLTPETPGPVAFARALVLRLLAQQLISLSMQLFGLGGMRSFETGLEKLFLYDLLLSPDRRTEVQQDS